MYKFLIYRSVIIIAVFALIFSSCQEDRVNDLDESLFGYQYFPLEIGKYWIYKVDSLIIDDVGQTVIQTSTFIKEEIASSYENEVGDMEYRIERSQSETRDGEYVITDAWKAEISATYAAKTEENLRFIKMVVPIDKDIDWRGNHFDELIRTDIAGERIWVYKDWGNYKVEANGIEFVVNEITYQDVVVIVQADFESDIERRYSKEYYAPDIGLIKKEMIIFDTQCICPGDTWFEKAQAGFTLKQNLLQHN